METKIELLSKLKTAIDNNTRFNYNEIMKQTAFRRIYTIAYAFHLKGQTFRLRDCVNKVVDENGNPYSRYQLGDLLNRLSGYGILDRTFIKNLSYYKLKDNFAKDTFIESVIEMENKNEV